MLRVLGNGLRAEVQTRGSASILDDFPTAISTASLL
jgi:hypothetical protein